MSKSNLISDEYKQLQIKTHEDNPEWGRAAQANASAILKFCKDNGFKKVLDYGCGKQRLRDALAPHGIEVSGYDPGIPGLDVSPPPHNLVVCIDVLEHIEPEYLDDVLQDIRRLTKKIGIFTISTRPAETILADGTNAHRIIEPSSWWLDRLCRVFSVHMFTREKDGFGVLVQ